MKYPDYGPYHDYPSSPVGGTNPYWQCVHCGATDPQINGRLSGHFQGCLYVKMKRKILRPMQPIFGISEYIVRQLVDWQVSNTELWQSSGLDRDIVLNALLSAKRQQGYINMSSLMDRLSGLYSYKLAGRGSRANRVLDYLKTGFTRDRITL